MDINSYALGLELQLSSKQAFDVLDQLETRLGAIEQKAASIAPVALGTKEQQQYNRVTELGAENVQMLDNTLRRLDANLNATRLAYASISEGAGAFRDEQNALREAFDSLSKEHDKILRQFNRMELQGVKLTAQEKAKVKRIHDTIDAMSDLKDATAAFIKDQEKQHKEISGLIDVLDHFGQSGQLIKKMFGSMRDGGMAAGLSAIFLYEGFKNLSEMMDAYATVNYRAMGSQSDLISVTNELRSSLGATAEEGIKTIQALSRAGFRATDSIQDLSKANYQFTQATGVSSDVTAEFQRRITAMGLSSTQATQGLEAMSNTIRKSGLSAAEAQTLISGLTQSMRALHFFYGNDATIKATKDMAGFVGAVKAAGGDVGAVTSQLNELAKSPIKTRIAFGLVHADVVKGVPQWEDYFGKVAKKMGQLNDKATQTGDTLSGEAMIKALHISSELADSYLLLWERGGKSVEGFKKLLVEGQKGADMTRDFNESMSTFTKSLQRVVQPLLAIGTALLDTVGPAFIELVKPLATLTTGLAKILEYLFKIPVAGSLVKAALGTMLLTPVINKISGLTKALGFMKTTATSTFKVFSGAASTFSGVTKAMGPMMSVLGPGMAKVLEPFKAFKAISAEAGGGMLGMGKGAMSVALNLAKVHPVITAVVAATAAALLIVPKFFEMMDSGNESVRNLGIVLGALFAPLVVFYLQLRAGWEILKAFWDVFSEVLTDVLKPAIDAFKEMTGTTGKSLGIMNMVNLVMEEFGKIMRSVFKFLVPVAKVLFIAFTPVLWLFKALTGTFNPLVGIFKVISTAGDVVKNILSSVWNFFKPLTDLINKAIKMWDNFWGRQKKDDNNIKKAFEDKKFELNKAVGITSRKIPLSIQHELAASANQLNVQKGLAVHAAHAVKQVHSPAFNRANPVAQRVAPASRPMSEADRKILDAHTKLREAVTQMHTTIEDTSAKQEKFDKLFQLLEQYLPQIAEGRDKGLTGPANTWN